MSVRTRFALCGPLAGAVNGFFGGAGAWCSYPLATRWGGLETRRAFASCTAVIWPMTALSACVYLLRGGLTLSLAWPYVLGGALGGLARPAAPAHPAAALRRVLALFILYGGCGASHADGLSHRASSPAWGWAAARCC
jgi:uncharacterized membrane protein YfcA